MVEESDGLTKSNRFVKTFPLFQCTISGWIIISLFSWISSLCYLKNSSMRKLFLNIVTHDQMAILKNLYMKFFKMTHILKTVYLTNTIFAVKPKILSNSRECFIPQFSSVFPPSKRCSQARLISLKLLFTHD